MTYLLVDVGYLFFYRYHATKLWYKKAHTYTDDLEMANDEKFQLTFQKKIADCLKDKLKKHKTSWDRVILCRDCRQSSIWRNSLYSEYKGNRDTSHLTGLAISGKLLRNAIFDLIRFNNAKTIGVKTAEADDIVYCCCKYLEKECPDSKIIIIASDHDYYQLLNENISMEGLDKRNHMSKSVRFTHNLGTDDAQKVDLLVKIISGDVSDNIKKIFPKCGAVTALKLAMNKTQLDDCFKKYPNSEAQFNENKKLVDMSELPETLKISIINKIKICLA